MFLRVEQAGTGREAKTEGEAVEKGGTSIKVYEEWQKHIGTASQAEVSQTP